MVKPEITILQLLNIILESMDDILEYSKDLTFEEYEMTKMLKKASRKDLEDIGDCCNEITLRQKRESFLLDKETKEEFSKSYRFRSKSTHGYDTLNYRIIFNVMKNKIPNFRKKILKLKEDVI